MDQYARGHCACCDREVPLYVARHHARVLARKSFRLPRRCPECRGEITVWGGYTSGNGRVHHKDSNPWNNVKHNLEVVHHGCHVRHHHVGAKRSQETKDKIRAKALGRVVSQATRDLQSASRKGVPKSAEHRARLSAALMGNTNGKRKK